MFCINSVVHLMIQRTTLFVRLNKIELTWSKNEEIEKKDISEVEPQCYWRGLGHRWQKFLHDIQSIFYYSKFDWNNIDNDNDFNSELRKTVN